MEPEISPLNPLYPCIIIYPPVIAPESKPISSAELSTTHQLIQSIMDFCFFLREPVTFSAINNPVFTGRRGANVWNSCSIRIVSIDAQPGVRHKNPNAVQIKWRVISAIENHFSM